MKKSLLIFVSLIIMCCHSTYILAETDNDRLVDDYIDMAKVYTSSAQYKQALDYINIIDKLSPNNPKILYEKAVILKNYNQPILSRNLMREIAEMAPEYKESYLYKEFFKDDLPGFYTPKEYDVDYYTKKGMDALENGKVEKAIDYLKKVVEQQRTPDTLNNLGVAYLKSKTPKEALNCFNKALYLDTQNPYTYLNFGIYYTDIEFEDKKAISYLKHSIRLNSTNFSPFFVLGNIYDKKNMFETSAEYYKLALSKDNTNVNIYKKYGNALMKLEKYNEAFSVFEKSLLIELDSPEIYQNITKAALEIGKYDEAESYIKKAIEINPTEENYFLLVKALYNKKNYNDCLKILNKKVNNNKSGEMFNYIGLCEFQLGKYADALTDFVSAISLEEKTSYYYNLAVCYNSLGDKTNTEKSIQTALHIQPNTEEDYLDIIKIYQDLGQNEKIINTLDQAITKYPNERKFYYLKSDLLKQMNKTDEYNTFNVFLTEKFKIAPIYKGK